ncbi:glycosyltransferase [Vacuolonema iberomarrocanum]|uniref:glycosyltransferase n=1 Tax=Vacuolonema iberomarrocanum TaxID=3454632 RepID=UPI001A03A1FE|nr:glycosyltransferase [filamentous cyanobacterium LEGE 07170]
MKVALVHDYLTQRGGAERVFELLCRRFPNADIFTSIYDPSRTITLGDRPIKTSFLQNIPGASRYFRLLAPLYYPAFRALDLQDYDLILTSTSSFAKAVRKSPTARHICFCHNITRFLWDTQTYLKEYRDFQQFYPFIDKIFRVMREADLRYAQEPDLYIANSSVVGQRIENIYKKPSVVINYPIDDSRFLFSDSKSNFFLASARLLSYKRIDIIVEAFNKLGWPLLVTGDGPERKRLQANAAKNVVFLGYVSDEERCRLLSQAQGVIVAALEDYGLVPIEANFSGTPVIAYGAGGVIDTQVPGKTGLFFEEQSAESLTETLLKFQEVSWDYKQIRNHAEENFTETVFFDKLEQVVKDVCGLPNLAAAAS